MNFFACCWAINYRKMTRVKLKFMFLLAQIGSLRFVKALEGIEVYSGRLKIAGATDSKIYLRNFVKLNFHLCIVMQEARDALSKLQTVTLFRPIRSLQCSWSDNRHSFTSDTASQRLTDHPLQWT